MRHVVSGLDQRADLDVSADLLSAFGLQLPALDPESAILIHLQKR